MIVFHANQDVFRDTSFYREHSTICDKVDIINFYKNGSYKNAGTVVTDSLDVAYEFSQNFMESWGDGNQRRTSVGDIIQDGDDFYVVASIGFDHLGAL